MINASNPSPPWKPNFYPNPQSLTLHHMPNMTSNEWLTGTHSGLINIDGHDLFLSTDGPNRVPGQPVVILESGLGGSSGSWPLVIHHLTPFIRIYIHDRAGLGKSSINPLANSHSPESYAEKAAEDLDKLLVRAGVEGPFILVPMSWGGIVAREFLERRKEDVVGKVMIECCTEKTGEIRPIDAPNTMAFLKGLDFFDVVGLRKRQRLTPLQWQVCFIHILKSSPGKALLNQSRYRPRCKKWATTARKQLWKLSRGH